MLIYINKTNKNTCTFPAQPMILTRYYPHNGGVMGVQKT